MKAVVELAEGDGVVFYCAGCNTTHRVNVGMGEGPRWYWNQSMDKPTFTPSVKVTYDHMSAAGRAKIDDSKKEHARYPDRNEIPYDEHHVCHVFVTDGFIQYLDDCTHKLRGNTMPLVPVTDWYPDEGI